ncbi:hypothetical protein BaRGS_00003811, partial [Batillaria attramentaria]
MKISPYGSWKSPISSKLVTTSGVGLVEVKVDINKEHDVYWTEIRFEEKGRYVVCSANKQTGKIQEWTPSGFNARTTVHEYGGGDFFVYDGAVYFSNFEDQALYVQRSPSAKPEPVTDTSRKWRYADGVFCPQTGCIYCVREDHEVVERGEAKECVNTLVAINPQTKEQTLLAFGADFYSHPRVSPDGKQLCWFQWNHPNMPWDSTEVWVADLDETGDHTVLKTHKKVAGSQESAIEPGWTADNKLLYVSDRSEWWNLYLVVSDDHHVNLVPVPTEIAGPQWTFGKTAYVADPAGSSKILLAQNYELGLLDMETKEYTRLETGFRYNKCLALTTTGDAYFIGSSETSFPCVTRFNIHTKELNIIKESVKNPVEKGYISMPSYVEWQTTEGDKSHGIFYPPQNKDFQAPEGTLPPLLVRAHGGPTGHYFANIDLKLQYFTSRGFAVLLVNYRGSTGLGRTYRHRLRNMWGVFDVDDCCTGVDHLVKQGKVDPHKVCIDGGSAGGYTTLACLTFRDTFKAGASHYGIGDLEALVADTHKFESRYMDTLLCPVSEDGGKVLRERSPIHYTERLSCPIALFQGDEDK